jgi:hypothetical protein
MTTSHWTDAVLDQARLEGDDYADRLATKVMSHEKGIHRYNHLLEVAETLVASPELALVESSELRSHLGHLYEETPEVISYYAPMEAPDWVDEHKLEIASAIWDENTLAVIGVLFAASLPECYLIEKGVPVLYRSEKLAESKYIHQRVYETCLMLDRVMEAGGIRTVNDYSPNQQELLVEVLNELEPEGNWTPEGVRVRRQSGDTAMPPALFEKLEKEFHERSTRKRYLWGEGYITAKKVRLLHASIRFMLQNPLQIPAHVDSPAQARTLTEALSRLESPWDKEKLGSPINQEDMAFVLLTFGYLIPRGLERWGCRLDREKKEAFLHQWKVVGHIMGIREDLMTDNWDEAKALHDKILNRQGGSSKEGEILTKAAMDYLAAYLPSTFGIRKLIPAQLITGQLGPEWAQKIIPAENFHASRKIVPRVAIRLGLYALRVYYWLREGVLMKTPILGGFLVPTLHESAEHLIDSWRETFRRRPFEVSEDGIWLRRRGANPDLEKKLARWRQKVFNTVALAVLFLGASVASLIPTILLALDEAWEPAGTWAIISIALALVSGAIMKWRLPRVLDRRPQLDDHPKSLATFFRQPSERVPA